MLRFAPSPTGDMHIGNLRAAILNYIIAKQRGEKFLIRIEDTDSARNIEGADKEILAILNLFGLFWDKLVYQSENFPLHRKLAQNLIEKNKAFYCYATKDFLEQKRAEASAQKRAFRYKDEWAEVCKGENEKPVIRLKGIAESSVGNSSLGLHSADFANLGHCADFSLALRPKFAKNHESQTENPSVVDSARNAQNLNQNNSVRSTQTRPLRGAKNRIQASSSASADFLLEAEKRGSPPKSEKAVAFWRVGGAGRGVQPFLRKETSEIDEKSSDRFAESITFFDAIKGECKFSQNEIDSFVIMRDDIPTYNFACAVDDMLYDISFIIRGEDHTSNTPKQMLIHRALGYDKSIKYAHLPIILNDEGKKMSKRESESSVKWLLSQGFLPRAIVNYLLLMGNNPPCEIFTLDEAIAWFDLSQLSKSPVRFDINQLRHINREHLKRLSESEMGLLLESSSELLSQVADNSVLGMQFRTKIAESTLDSAESQNLNENNPRVSANLESRPLRGAKNREQGCSSATADFLLEADKRGSPPKSEKRQLLARRGSGAGGAALLREESSNLSSEGIAESSLDSAKSQNLQNGLQETSHSLVLPRRFCESAHNDDSFLDSANRAKITKSLGAIGKIFLEEASTLNELNDKLNHIFAPKDLKNFEFGENARILKGEILRLLAESNAQSCPLNDFNSLKDALSKNAPFKGKAFFMPLRFLLTGAQKGPHLDNLYPHLRPFLTQILKD